MITLADENLTIVDWASVINNAYNLLTTARAKYDDLSIDLAENGLNNLLDRYSATLVTGNKRSTPA